MDAQKAITKNDKKNKNREKMSEDSGEINSVVAEADKKLQDESEKSDENKEPECIKKSTKKKKKKKSLCSIGRSQESAKKNDIEADNANNDGEVSLDIKVNVNSKDDKASLAKTNFNSVEKSNDKIPAQKKGRANI